MSRHAAAWVDGCVSCGGGRVDLSHLLALVCSVSQSAQARARARARERERWRGRDAADPRDSVGCVCPRGVLCERSMGHHASCSMGVSESRTRAAIRAVRCGVGARAPTRRGGATAHTPVAVRAGTRSSRLPPPGSRVEPGRAPDSRALRPGRAVPLVRGPGARRRSGAAPAERGAGPLGHAACSRSVGVRRRAWPGRAALVDTSRPVHGVSSVLSHDGGRGRPGTAGARCGCRVRPVCCRGACARWRVAGGGRVRASERRRPETGVARAAGGVCGRGGRARCGCVGGATERPLARRVRTTVDGSV